MLHSKANDPPLPQLHMTQTIYGWIVIKKDGTPFRNRKTDSLAIFADIIDARIVAIKTGGRAVPCTSQYEV
jgi:hypothetical protein